MRSQTYQQAIFVKNTRYYSIQLEQDLLEDWVISRNFGRRGAIKGRTIREICENLILAHDRFAKLCKYRVKNRNYRQI